MSKVVPAENQHWLGPLRLLLAGLTELCKQQGLVVVVVVVLEVCSSAVGGGGWEEQFLDYSLHTGSYG